MRRNRHCFAGCERLHNLQKHSVKCLWHLYLVAFLGAREEVSRFGERSVPALMRLQKTGQSGHLDRTAGSSS